MKLPVDFVVKYSDLKKINKKGTVITITSIVIKHNPQQQIRNRLLLLVVDELSRLFSRSCTERNEATLL